MLNLVLTLFCQGNEVEYLVAYLKARAKGKAKNNPIPIMLIGQGRGGKSTLMRRHAHARGIITTKEQQDKRKGINKNSHSCIKHPARR